MLRRAKSVDIPFMVKGYEIGLRDGNFSQSQMQINAFFAKTTTHKNVHSYIYEHNGGTAGYAVLRKKDDGRHEVMMMFVDAAQQGQGIGRRLLNEVLAGPMKDSPIICSTTQPASVGMMKLLKANSFERKIETAEGIYWEKRAGGGQAARSKSAPPPSTAGMTGTSLPRLALPMPLLVPENAPHPDAEALTAATTVVPLPINPYSRGAPPSPPTVQVLEGVAEEVAASPPPSVPDAPEAAATDSQIAHQETEREGEAEDKTLPPPLIPLADTAALPTSGDALAKLPKPPADFSGRPTEIAYSSKQKQARQLARELFASLKGTAVEPSAEATPSALAAEVPSALQTDEEDIPLLATVNVVREKMGSLPGVTLPPIDRYGLMEFNKKDLENMNVVELAALSAQLIKLARDQLAQIDRLQAKAKPKGR